MASLFLDFPCQSPSEENVLLVEWCPVEVLVAVATDDFQINFYGDEGALLPACVISRKYNTTSIKWRHKSPVLATGWADGHIGVYSINSGAKKLDCVYTNDTSHSGGISFMMWNPASNRLVSGDSKGLVRVWKADGRARLSQYKQYSTGNGRSATTCGVFSSAGALNSRSEFLGNAFSPSFFFGSAEGKVFFADDLGHSVEVQSLSSSIDTMLFYTDKNRLVIITRALLLTQLQVADDGRVTPVQKVKLSIAGSSTERGIKQVVWAGPGLIAAATGESLVRFWNLANDENYVLSVGTCKPISRTDKVLCVGFNPHQRYLAVGTKEGKVGLWRYIGPEEGDVDASAASGGVTSVMGSSLGGQSVESQQHQFNGSVSASDWDAMTPTAVGWKAAVTCIGWGPLTPGGAVLAAGGNLGCSVLREDVLNRIMCHGSIAALQLTSQLVRIERLGLALPTDDGNDMYRTGGYQTGGGGAVPNESFIVRSGMNIRGLCVSETNLAVWNGQQAEVWALHDNEAVQISVHATTARAMVFSDRDEYLFRAVGSDIQQCNLQGRVTKKIPFSEGEGQPILLDVNNSFLAVATSLGLIKIFDLSRREKGGAGAIDDAASGAGKAGSTSGAPKQIGSSGKFVDPTTGESLGEIRSIRVNATGNRVSILGDHVRGALRVREPDAKLHVYDADRDVVESYDCAFRTGGAAGSRYPVNHHWDSSEPKLLAIETRRVRNRSGVNDTGAGSPTTSGSGNEEKEGSDGGLENAYGQARRSEGEEKDGGEDALSAGVMSPTRSRSSNREAHEQLMRLKRGGKIKTEYDAEVMTLFVTSDYGVQMQGSFPLEAPLETLIGLQVPKLYFSSKKDGHDDGNNEHGSDGYAHGPFLVPRVLQDFVGLEDVDDETKAALLDFSYYLTIKNMDEAHRAVKLIKKASVWENMAHMCVKTKRLDVAEVCLGNMGFARGAAAVRLAKSEPEPEARIAAVAVQLGLIHDADRLYRECGRFDLLNKLYQASGCWDRALEVASDKDRIHLKTTHHQFAKHLEDIGDVDRAIHHFQEAETHRTQVPRMLFDRKRTSDLEDYVARDSDVELQKWWAGYCESLGQYDKAMHFYQRAGDHFALVRIACYNREIGRAKQIVEETSNPAAAYYLARYLEGISEIQEAINYYALSKCFNHAIRLAKNFGLDAELMSYALKSRSALMIECALYFEERGDYEKAVQLFQRGGDIPKALDLCFKAGEQGQTGMFEVLRTIASELDENTSPQTVARCAEFFITHGQFEKAVQLFITGKRFMPAIKLCEQHKVRITEEMAEGLTPPKPSEQQGGAGSVMGPRSGSSNPFDNDRSGEDRNEVLQALAKACKKQGSFQLACKKYTQAGQRVKAMKCLLKSGDTKNITYYATVSRIKEIYILAANYLQSLDWQNDPETMKNIVLFYTKAKAFEPLAHFFDAYAQMEIDEYRDYEKALNALQKAEEYMTKARGDVSREEKVQALKLRIMHIQQFVQARALAKTNPEQMVSICTGLLHERNARDVEMALRVGDCYALLIEFYYSSTPQKQPNWTAAYELIQEMKHRKIGLDPYLEKDMIHEIYRKTGHRYDDGESDGAGAGVAGGSDVWRPGDDDDEVGEDIDEEVDDEISDDGIDQPFGRK